MVKQIRYVQLLVSLVVLKCQLIQNTQKSAIQYAFINLVGTTFGLIQEVLRFQPPTIEVTEKYRPETDSGCLYYSR